MGDRGMIAGTIYFQALWLPMQWSGEMAPSGPLREPGLRAHLPELEMESSQQGKCMHQNILCLKGAIQVWGWRMFFLSLIPIPGLLLSGLCQAVPHSSAAPHPLPTLARAMQPVLRILVALMTS